VVQGLDRLAAQMEQQQQRDSSAVVSDDEKNNRFGKDHDDDDDDEYDDDDESKNNNNAAAAAKNSILLSKRRLREQLRPSVAQLKGRVARPDLVEAHDVTAPDPEFLIQLKAASGTVPVPRHWGRKRKYLQGKVRFDVLHAYVYALRFV
jgi:splicing factor 3B subunit 2